MIYVYQEYKVRIKMEQEQQLQLKIKFLLGYNMKIVFLLWSIDQWCGESAGGNFLRLIERIQKQC